MVGKPASGSVVVQRERLVEGLRVFAGQYKEFSHRFAAWLGLHSTDALALLEILAAEERGTPLSPARLSGRISLSPGATTALLNRLEEAGHIVRSRESTDRRVVTLRGGTHIQERADVFFGPLAERLDALLEQYPSELLDQFDELLSSLRDAIDAQLVQRNPDA
ncbi:DNA-binding MarR family transcriptional regulator [Streptomyces griseochromogenes]|uniref:DNA-binding MarR family transcriptional regulator n=1 Tax=Streptomyces griseochromogenes TaxID=68214 RepID=A0ABS4M9X8_9ACTN|nr:DNA-binding MarR family transcriptional regulator [Streptomyces griseochromogenes]